jgi:hypothetical protein
VAFVVAFSCLMTPPAMIGRLARPALGMSFVVALAAGLTYGVWFCVKATGYDQARVGIPRFEYGAYYAAVQWTAVLIARSSAGVNASSAERASYSSM